jgi:hypothetical protein
MNDMCPGQVQQGTANPEHASCGMPEILGNGGSSLNSECRLPLMQIRDRYSYSGRSCDRGWSLVFATVILYNESTAVLQENLGRTPTD